MEGNQRVILAPKAKLLFACIVCRKLLIVEAHVTGIPHPDVLEFRCAVRPRPSANHFKFNYSKCTGHVFVQIWSMVIEDEAGPRICCR